MIKNNSLYPVIDLRPVLGVPHPWILAPVTLEWRNVQTVMDGWTDGLIDKQMECSEGFFIIKQCPHHKTNQKLYYVDAFDLIINLCSLTVNFHTPPTIILWIIKRTPLCKCGVGQNKNSPEASPLWGSLNPTCLQSRQQQLKNKKAFGHERNSATTGPDHLHYKRFGV